MSSVPTAVQDGEEEAPHYHERQRLQRCAVHAINNLLQEPRFCEAQLDAIASQLCPGALPLLNPHRTPVLGNYDVNVVEAALAQAGLELRWHDRRDEAFDTLGLDSQEALILNVKSAGAWHSFWGGRHWVSLLRLRSGAWWAMDSKLPRPRRLGERAALLEYLAQQQDLQAFTVHSATSDGARATPGG